MYILVSYLSRFPYDQTAPAQRWRKRQVGASAALWPEILSCVFWGQHMMMITMNIWGFPRMGVPKNGWFITVYESPLKMDDFGVPLF